MIRIVALLLPLSVLLGAGTLLADGIRGKPAVVDARTMEVAGERLRLFGIDAPDPGQPCRLPKGEIDCGRIATTALLDLVAASEVVCTPVAGAEPEPGVRLARCSAGGFDVGANMVYTGWALPIPGDPAGYGPQADTARQRGHGMWKGTFEMPWIWRRWHGR